MIGSWCDLPPDSWWWMWKQALLSRNAEQQNQNRRAEANAHSDGVKLGDELESKHAG